MDPLRVLAWGRVEREKLPDWNEMLREPDLRAMQKRRDGRGPEGRTKVRKEEKTRLMGALYLEAPGKDWGGVGRRGGGAWPRMPWSPALRASWSVFLG